MISLRREVVTFGKTPYPGLENAEVVDKVCDDDYRMAQPENCPGPLYVAATCSFFSAEGKADLLTLLSICFSYAIMRNCWEEEPEDRPMFQDLYQELAVGKQEKGRQGTRNVRRSRPRLQRPPHLRSRRSPASSARSPLSTLTRSKTTRYFCGARVDSSSLGGATHILDTTTAGGRTSHVRHAAGRHHL